MRTSIRLAFALAIPLVVLGAGAGRADECSSMWYGRNQIYKNAGYCFKTARAIAEFGNAGCQYDDIRDVPLSARDQATIARYVRGEQLYDCRQ